ncbi:class I SAM-dependent DNA methyltransferase [Bacillus kexueae]|uniref:class I SAM-dependent DNA methyltransferase n=1 Tax=Aeribacillus kexueae TaxID=2078952 RepID=UPI001FB00FC8|nr:class I SAM-dependent methyltransferase [Bacillus kexueae]
MYQHFAYIYDELMKEAPYEEWTKYYLQMVRKFGNGGNRTLDLACGTGEMSVRFAKEGFHVTGVDLSIDMLTVAKEKMERHGYSDALFVNQDMRNLEGFDSFDYVFICCDSLNYLLEEYDIQEVFKRAYDVLAPGGLIMFDVHSLYKVESLFKGNTFAYNGDDISYIWNCFAGEASNSVVHELTFFVQEGDVYRRYDEDHEQRTFPIESYKLWLKQAGFSIVDVSTGLIQTSFEKAERIFFVAKK